MIGIVIILLILCGVVFFVSRQYIYITAVQCEDNPQTAAQLLMEKQLDSSCSPKINERNRLLDYEIVKIGSEDARTDMGITLTWDNSHDFLYAVEYNVQTAAASSDWVSGNGEYGSDNWINGKFGFIAFHKVLGIYIYDHISTGP